jgi:hypothetical protein
MTHTARHSRARLRLLWPRRFVLRASGEPVDILHLTENAEGRRCLVELEDGRLRELDVEELDSRPRLGLPRLRRQRAGSPPAPA